MNEKFGLFLSWTWGRDEALRCLVLVANGESWREWLQHENDTRGIVTERAAKYLRRLFLVAEAAAKVAQSNLLATYNEVAPADAQALIAALKGLEE